MHCFRVVFQPGGKVLPIFPDQVQVLVVNLPLFPKDLVHGKDMVGIKAPPVKFPKGQHPPRAAIAVPEGMDCLEPVMEYPRRDDRGPFSGFFLPPIQKLAKGKTGSSLHFTV